MKKIYFDVDTVIEHEGKREKNITPSTEWLSRGRHSEELVLPMIKT
jgi:hypothetical protein